MNRSLLVLLFAWVCLAGGGPASAADETADSWIELLASPDIPQRWYATHMLARLGPQAARAVEPLRKILADKSEYEYVRGGAAWALGRIGKAAEPAVPELIDTLGSNHLSVRRNAPLALARIGGPARQAEDKLVPLLKDADIVVRANAAMALWKLAEHPRAIPTLEAMLNAGGPGAYEASVALGRLAPDAEAALPVLVAALAHSDADAARAAARSVARFGKAALPALEKSLSDTDADAGLRSVEALGQIGPPAVPALVKAMKHSQAIVRRGAARELGQLGPAAAEARPALLTAASDTDADVRETAAAALKQVASK